MSDEAAPERLHKSLRLFRMAHLLREQQSTVRDIARHLYPGVSVHGSGWEGIERAIQRDLNDLRMLEPDFDGSAGRPPRYWINTHRTRLHPVETLVLHTAARLTYHRASGQKTHHAAALRTLTGWLPPHLQGVMGRSLSDLGERRTRGREDLNLEHAAAAWLGQYPLHFEYRKPGGSGTWRTNIVEPYLIEAHPQNLDLYVIGRETTFHNDVRTFKLSRMRALQVQRDRTYRIPDTFDPRQFFHAAWGVVGTQGAPPETIALRFRAEAAYRILEGGYAHLSEPVINRDGSIDVSVAAPVDSSGLPREVLPWILSFGSRVNVLGPPHIRDYWLGELAAAGAQAQEDMAQEAI
ncbi:helix-turn-helix transcriptional regulator [Deinococcus petrolearius]|uniref:Helix-turn-helix transcriptional regulator n=1 Tax=Deinococcus petrolearius TaxID=1751295 RepID=A0ABW1DKR6_9DEIO